MMVEQHCDNVVSMSGVSRMGSLMSRSNLAVTIFNRPPENAVGLQFTIIIIINVAETLYLT